MRIIIALVFAIIPLSFTLAQKPIDVSDPTPLLDKPLPNFEGVTLDNKKFNLADHKGKVVVVAFWSLSCAACFKEIPEFNRLAEEYSPDELVIISVMPDSKEDVDKRISKDGQWYKLNKPVFKNDIINYQVVVDGEKVMSQYELTKTFPQTFVIDQEGMVRKYSNAFLDFWREDGPVKAANYQNFKTTIDKLIKK